MLRKNGQRISILLVRAMEELYLDSCTIRRLYFISFFRNSGSPFSGNPAHPPAGRNPVGPPSFQDGASPPVKSCLCNKYNSAEGCKFSDKCHFAHGEWELGRPTLPSYEDPRAMGPPPGRYGSGRIEPSPPGLGAAASFGASATAKISVDASLAGAIIGKSGVNSKQICRLTGAKLSIREHESDPNLRNIELEGTFDQIKQASAMVSELIVNIGSASGPPMKNPAISASAPASNFKTKLCENFAKGTCTFGDRCLGGAIIGKSCVNSKQICLILIIFILIGCLIFPHLLKNEFQYNVRGNLEH